METVQVECCACDGSGLYRGLAEPKGTAVVYLECDGTGCMEISFTPFTRRKGVRGVERVNQSRGSFVGTGVGPAHGYITYQEFQQGKMP